MTNGAGTPVRPPVTVRAAGTFLLLGAFCALIARQTRRGYRGGLVLAVLLGAFVTCSGAGLTNAPAPYHLLAVVPLTAGIAIVVLLIAPAASRAWFRPRR